MKPVRSKKNGSERTPAQAQRSLLPTAFEPSLAWPWATVRPPLRLTALPPS
jgi:hypothetical protein